MYLTIYMTLFLAKTLKSRRVQIVDVRSSNLAQWFISHNWPGPFWRGRVQMNGKRVLLVLSSLWASLRVTNLAAIYKMARWTVKLVMWTAAAVANQVAFMIVYPLDMVRFLWLYVTCFMSFLKNRTCIELGNRLKAEKKEIRTLPNWEVYSLIVLDADRWLLNKGLSVKRKAKQTYTAVRC